MSKFLKFFDNNEQRSAYELSEQYVSPYVSAIKGTNGGGVEPHYNLSSNVPPNALCILTLKDNSKVYIKGENVLEYSVMQSYNEDAINAIVTNRCTSLKESAFFNFTHLTSIIIPDSVTSIGSSAFMGCDSLASIVIPQSVTNIGNGIFTSCISLQNVTLPNTITKLDVSFFDGCTSLEHISLPNTLKEIGWYVFNSTGLKELIIPEGVTKLGRAVVQSCPNLESITFPSSIENVIKDDWFKECEKLREIKIMGRKNLSDILPFDNVKNKSDLTLYVDSSLVDTYKAKRDSMNGHYNILPLE